MPEGWWCLFCDPVSKSKLQQLRLRRLHSLFPWKMLLLATFFPSSEAGSGSDFLSVSDVITLTSPTVS